MYLSERFSGLCMPQSIKRKMRDKKADFAFRRRIRNEQQIKERKIKSI